MIDPQDAYIFSVRELNDKAKNLLEQHFSQVWISGEISNLSRPSSGHMYFTLKDPKAQVRCAFFRGKQWSLKVQPQDGMEVLVCAKLSLYPERGDYQLIVEHLLPGGEGLLKQQFEALKRKLEQAGLFDKSHKKPLPERINTLGVITSKSGAALQDVLSVIKRRWPLLNVIVYDSQVQGDKAPAELIAAIRHAEREDEVDALLITRGGGSLEDLWAFNDEALAHTIHRCILPVVSAVGHEVDFSISDYVADLRAPTPSAAAEMLTPNQQEIKQNLSGLTQDLCDSVYDLLDRHRFTLESFQKRIRTPQQMLDAKSQHLDFCRHRLESLITAQIQQAKNCLSQLKQPLYLHDPLRQCEQTRTRLHDLQHRLTTFMRRAIDQRAQAFSLTAGRLDAISPLSTLQRGYAIAQKQDGKVLTDVSDVKRDDEITIRLRQGKLTTTVTNILES